MISAALKMGRKILVKLRRKFRSRSASTTRREVARELTAAWSRELEEFPSYFVELPTEIHLQILAFVNLEDVIAIRQTCKTMASITRMRAVWIMVIQSLGPYTSEIFHNSYDLMSMQRQEVERLALRAFCFSKALLNPETPILSRKHTELLLPSINVSPLKATNSLTTKFDNCLLVSGGRYLFTTARPQSLLLDEWGSDYVHLWDLDSSQELSTRTDPIVSAHFQDYGIQLHAAFPTTCGTGLRLLVYARRNEETLNSADAGRYHLYEVFPRDEHPGFKLVAELRIERTWIIFYGHFPNEVIFHIENKLIVWNLETGDSFETNVGEAYPAILATDRHIALVSASDVVIWAFMPSDDISLSRKTLVSRQRLPIPFATTGLIVAASPFGLSISLPQDPEATPLISIQYVSEASGSSDYILNDVFELRSTTTSGGTCHFYLRRCHPTSVKLTLKGNLDWMQNSRTGIQTSGCYFQSAVMATAREKDHIRVLVTPVPGRIGSSTSRRRNVPFTQHIRLLRLKKEAVLGHWLCPISGRLVLLLNARRRRLYVIDFCPRTHTGVGNWSTALTFSHSKVDICI